MARPDWTSDESLSRSLQFAHTCQRRTARCFTSSENNIFRIRVVYNLAMFQIVSYKMSSTLTTHLTQTRLNIVVIRKSPLLQVLCCDSLYRQCVHLPKPKSRTKFSAAIVSQRSSLLDLSHLNYHRQRDVIQVQYIVILHSQHYAFSTYERFSHDGRTMPAISFCLRRPSRRRHGKILHAWMKVGAQLSISHLQCTV